MAQYINKDALVAEFKRRISLFKKEKKIEKWSAEASLYANVISLGARIAMLEEILSFLNTLEVKEVDLENETQKILDKHFFYPEEDDELKETPKLARYIAKHFFQLGLNTQKGE